MDEAVEEGATVVAERRGRVCAVAEVVLRACILLVSSDVMLLSLGTSCVFGYIFLGPCFWAHVFGHKFLVNCFWAHVFGCSA